MKAEKIILSFVAILIGLLAAGGAFYLYQMTKTIPKEETKPTTFAIKNTPVPTPDLSNFLTIDKPKDEELFTSPTITISGKTAKDATLIISSEETDQVVQPSTTGNFSLTTNIGKGTSLIQVTAVYPNGEEQTAVKTVTYSTENF